MLDNLITLRSRRNVSQAKLAAAIGTTQQCISSYENTDVEPNIETLKKIAAYFSVSVDYLIGFDPQQHELLDEERALLFRYHQLTDKQRECLKLIMETWL